MQKKKSLGILSDQKGIVFIIVILLYIFFSIISKDFRKYSTLVMMLDSTYYILLMAIGVTFPLITGGVDLSIGTGMICYGLTGGYLVVQKGFPTWVGLLVAVSFGLIIGIINGVLIAIMDLPPFLATLCTCMMTRGLGSICAKSFAIPWPGAKADGGWFHAIFKLTVGAGRKAMKYPVGVIVLAVIVLIMSFVLNHTRVGRYTIAIGSNKEATRLSGVNVKAYHITAYAISGLFAGLASLAYAAAIPTIQPGTGAGLELDAIGGAIVGGVSPTGGAGSIIGTMLGVFVIQLLKTGLPYIGLEANWQQIVTGLVLIGAVLIDVIKQRRAALEG